MLWPTTEIIDHYKYLGVSFHEHMSPSHTVKALTCSASCSFERVVGIFKELKNLGWKTYQMLFNAYVMPILNYGAGVWGFGDQSDPQVLQNRIACFYLGVHKFTAVAATQLETDWLYVCSLRWLEIVRYKNR